MSESTEDKAADGQDEGGEEAPKEKKKSDLLPRALTAVVMVPLLILMFFANTHWYWTIFISAAAVVGLFEFYDMTQRDEPRYVKYASTAIGTAFFVSIVLFVGPKAVVPVAQETMLLFMMTSGVVWLSFLFNLMRPRDMQRVANTINASIAGVFFIGLSFAFIVLLKRDFGVNGGAWVLLLLASCWSSDTGAYFAGRALGGKIFSRRMAPTVSPKKSIEGGIGGLISTILAVLIIKLTLLEYLSMVDVFVIAIPANFLGQTGDLCESLIKRACGVKDSGTIIHGHGGMLDRVDAVLFVAPYIYLIGFLTGGRALIA